jgi:hypothetical protein
MRGVYIVSAKPPNQSVKLTKTVVEQCPLPATGQAFLRDSQLPGFALRVTARGTRAFIVEKRINARVRRITLGRFGELTVEEARRKAKITLGQIAFGTDPIAEKRQARLKALTLCEVYREFAKARKPHLKPRTLYDYDLLMRGVFKDWQRKAITGLRKPQVSQRHWELGEQLRQPSDAFSAGRAQFRPGPNMTTGPVTHSCWKIPYGFSPRPAAGTGCRAAAW